MSFRRDNQKSREWQLWVRANQDRLISAGVPREVWEERMTWWRFVDHGYHPPVSNAREVRFKVDDLSDPEQRRLFEFLRDTLSDRERIGSSLWVNLHNRFGREDSDKAMLGE